MNTFEAGKTYSTRSIGDSNCAVTLSVISRTAKTIKAQTVFGIKTLRISTYGNAEQVSPWGRYSMAPIIDATDLVQGA